MQMYKNLRYRSRHMCKLYAQRRKTRGFSWQLAKKALLLQRFVAPSCQYDSDKVLHFP